MKNNYYIRGKILLLGDKKEDNKEEQHFRDNLKKLSASRAHYGVENGNAMLFIKMRVCHDSHPTTPTD